ncbi:hypothetical protein ACO2Q3_06750 [Caulobacter sp. KR2-114]|uniref:hypothetical protein n=1 Tax=Caulobacter sp. KR2-114 TaxID=3400912 RepID=UPI003C0B7E75
MSGRRAKVILLGGSSHAGKSSVAAVLAARLGWEARSTDYLARHPGRPWPVGDRPVPPHVVEYYRDLSDAARMDSVLAHYRRLAPQIVEIVRAHLAPAAPGLVFEGSALLPETVAEVLGPGVAAFWVTADPALVARRMQRESGHAAADAEARALIDAFLRRSLDFDRLFADEARAAGLSVLRVVDGETVEAAAERVLALTA